VVRQPGITCDSILQNEDWYTLVKHNTMNELFVARQAGITCDTILQNEDWYTHVKHNSMNELCVRRDMQVSHVTQYCRMKTGRHLLNIKYE